MIKYILFSLLLFVSCTTSRIELQGTIEDYVYYGDTYYIKYKVWSLKNNKYYYVISDKMYNIGDTITIK